MKQKNFFIKVGFGLVTPGHVIQISKQHLSCFGELPDNLIAEYNELKNLTIEKITSKFFTPFLFESGVLAQSVHHAHVHFIPLERAEYKIKRFF